MLTDEQILENLRRHRTQPNVSVTEYFQSLQNTLSGDLVGRRRIYLDTKYWILLRDAALGRPRSHSHIEILSLLRALVSKGTAICPLSDAAYAESMQQTDGKTRLATADLMDELSCGVAVATEKTRIRMELLNFVATPIADVGSLRDKVWVKTGFVLGEKVPHVKTWDAEANLVAQKSFIDLMWFQTVADFATQEQGRGMTSLQTSAVRINQKMEKYADEIRSFEQAAKAEFSGCVNLFSRKLAEAALIEKGHQNATAEQIGIFQETVQRGLFNCRQQHLTRQTVSVHFVMPDLIAVVSGRGKGQARSREAVRQRRRLEVRLVPKHHHLRREWTIPLLTLSDRSSTG